MDLGQFDDLFEVIDLDEGNAEEVRVPKRYIRNVPNPLQYYDEAAFKQRYRFSKAVVTESILPLIENDLQKENNRGLPFSPLLKLLICLRFFATGNFQIVSGDLRGVTQPSVSRIIKTVSTLLAQQLRNYVMFPPTVAEQRQNIVKFMEIARCPTIAGCVDGVHIPIANPGGENAEVYRNRKGIFTLNVQIVGGLNLEIMDIGVRHPGSTHDSVIFDRAAVRVRFEEGQVLGILLGDNGYPCRPYLLTPVLQPQTPSEENYNRAHKRTHNTVERLFGVWKKRFPCLSRQLNTKLETTQAIICACAVLHNIGRNANDNIAEEEEGEVEHGPEMENINRNRHGIGLEYRRYFITRNF